MKANQACYPVAMMCRLLEVFTSGFHAWSDRRLSAHVREDIELTALIQGIHEYSHGAYGAPRVHAELQQGYGVHIARKRVARLMRAAGLRGISKRRFVRTTVSDARARWAPDLVDRDFTVTEPDRRWVADATFISTWEGFLYLAIVLDVFSRRIVGWAMSAQLRTELLLAALEMAYGQRTPHDVIHHSDHGSTPQSRSGNAARSSGFAPPWDRSGMRTTMPWRRASSPRSSARCRTAITSRPAKRRAPRSLPGSKAGTIRTGVIPRSAITRHATSSASSSAKTRSRTRRFCHAARGRLRCG